MLLAGSLRSSNGRNRCAGGKKNNTVTDYLALDQGVRRWSVQAPAQIPREGTLSNADAQISPALSQEKTKHSTQVN